MTLRTAANQKGLNVNEGKSGMDERERIEEAHGLWELAVTRLAALAHAGAPREMIDEAVESERDAFALWEKVSAEILEATP